jgi:hypothetical protein
MSPVKELYWSYLAALSVTAMLELFHASKILSLPDGLTDREIQSYIFHHASDEDVQRIFNSTESPLNLAHDPYWSWRFFFAFFPNGFERFYPMSLDQVRHLNQAA